MDTVATRGSGAQGLHPPKPKDQGAWGAKGKPGKGEQHMSLHPTTTTP